MKKISEVRGGQEGEGERCLMSNGLKPGRRAKQQQVIIPIPSSGAHLQRPRAFSKSYEAKRGLSCMQTRRFLSTKRTVLKLHFFSYFLLYLKLEIGSQYASVLTHWSPTHGSTILPSLKNSTICSCSDGSLRTHQCTILVAVLSPSISL